MHSAVAARQAARPPVRASAVQSGTPRQKASRIRWNRGHMPAASKRRRNRRHDRREWPTTAALAMFVLILFAGHASAQTPPTVQPSSDLKKLKRLSLDELQAIEVTSVSKHPEKLSGAASSIQVITGDDIRRAGATSLPEALRLASNLQVAQVGSQGWAITARGFNNTSANKLLVL